MHGILMSSVLIQRYIKNRFYVQEIMHRASSASLVTESTFLAHGCVDLVGEVWSQGIFFSRPVFDSAQRKIMAAWASWTAR